jgi:predicted nucleotidyltransferase
MADAGVVEHELIGRQGLYRASVASPLFEPLRQLVERSVGVEALLRDLVLEVPGVETAAIFGSWARGKVDAESDVDVLVTGDFDYPELISRSMELQERTGREINIVAMRTGELRERMQEGNGFVRDIMASPMKFLVGSLDDV